MATRQKRPLTPRKGIADPKTLELLISRLWVRFPPPSPVVSGVYNSTGTGAGGQIYCPSTSPSRSLRSQTVHPRPRPRAGDPLPSGAPPVQPDSRRRGRSGPVRPPNLLAFQADVGRGGIPFADDLLATWSVGARALALLLFLAALAIAHVAATRDNPVKPLSICGETSRPVLTAAAETGAAVKGEPACPPN